MGKSLKIGTVSGIGLYLHWTFWLLPLLVFIGNLDGGSVGLPVYWVTLTFGVFGCVLLHELGHALMARHFGIRTRDITLYPIGGVARLERLSDNPWEEFCIALAGPAVNLVIAAALFFGLAVSGGPLLPFGPGFTLGFSHFLPHLMWANAILVAFNMLPAFPMDGGRVLRAVLAAYYGQLQATEIAAFLAIPLAVLIGVGGLFVLHSPLSVFVAFFVFLASRQELAMVRYKASRREQEPLEVLPVYDDFVDAPVAPMVANFSGFTWDGRTRAWVEWRNGRPIQTIFVP